MFQLLTLTVFVFHIGAGLAALAAGAIALFSRKGGPLHRAAGKVFLFAMMVMAVFAAYLGFALPGQLVNVFIAGLTAYLVVTGWLAVHRPVGATGPGEWVCAAVSL